MKTWDLNSGAAKIELAVEVLQRAWKDANTHWSDETSRKFQEEYLAPLEPKVKRAIDGIHRLTEILANAERECRSQ